MKSAKRIPTGNNYTLDGMLHWFAEMSSREFLFHPNDEPNDIVRIQDGKPVFSKMEADQLRKILDRMFEKNGDDVYEAAYPFFMNRMGIRLDA